MRIFGILAVVHFLLQCNYFLTISSLELKPRPSKTLDRTILTQDVDTTKIDTQQSGDRMSIVDTFVGNRGKGSNTGGLLYRRGQVFYTAARVFADYKLVQWRCNQMKDADEAEINDLWNQAHERNAVFLGSKFISLEGLWVKLGQYLSSRADVMPDPYLRVLAKCQDSLPAKPFSVIKAQVEFELGRSLQSVFSHVDETPLACASIAQVHKAKLVDGRDVVIKVQHAEVAERLLQDLRNLETIGDTIKHFEPDFDFSPVIREWASEIPKELDFRTEAANMQQVERNLSPMLPKNSKSNEETKRAEGEAVAGDDLEELSIDVSLPQVIQEYVTEKLLVMSYIDGFKVDNKPFLDQYGADKESIVRNITRAFAHQIFVDGFYTADPHPGNLLVDVNTLKPVLLDFGLTKEVTPEARFHFSKLLVSAAEQDIVGLLDALDGVGLKLRPDVPFDAQLLAKYFFRDANKQAEAREESVQRRADMKKKADELKERMKLIYAGDMVDVTLSEGFNRIFNIKTSRKGKVISVTSMKEVVENALAKSEASSSGEDAQTENSTVTVLFTNGEQMEVQRSAVSVQKGRSPIDAWPDAFIFFDRVLGLLRGLTASLDVSQSYLEVMTPYARKALADKYIKHKADMDSALMEKQGGGSAISITKDVRGEDKLGGIAELIQRLIDSGDVLGCQVCVLENDKPIVDLSAGRQSPYDGQPVSPDTIFNCFSVTKGVAAGAVHILAERGLVDMNAPMSQYWPAFAANGKEGITVAHVLNHQAGLANAGLQEISRDPFVVCDNDLILSIMAQSTPEHEPGAQTNYHYLTFGWLVEGLVQSVTGGSLRDFVNANIAVEQNIQSEFMIGIGSGNAVDQQHADRLPAVSSNEREVANRVANLVLGRIVMPPRPAAVTSDVATATAAAAAASASSAAAATAAASATATPTAAAATATATTSNTVASTSAAAPHAPVETEVETKAEVVVKVDHSLNQKSVTVQGNKVHTIKSESFKERPPSGPSLFTNPTFFNNPRIRQASIPSANGHFSARALAKYYSTIKLHTPQAPKGNAVEPTSLSGEMMLQGGAGSFYNGFQLFPSSDGTTGAPKDIKSKGMSFGHGGIGGSVAFCRPDPKRKLAVAVTLNRLSFDSSKTTGEIVREIFKKLNEPVPLQYAKKNLP